ncbi:MAG: transketolase [Cyanobacteria bacterium SIG28]|nr:transketolase [Cyanobacteria bacterium SIG28]
MLSNVEIEELKKTALNVRKNILKMIHSAKSGHPGGSLSGADILTLLYKKVLNIPTDWDKSENFNTRDRFILSKGHASPVLYAVLAEIGFIEEAELMTFRKLNSRLQGHPSRNYIHGVEASTGSLGQGLSLGCGIAMGLKLDSINAKTFVYLGDGELQEGSCWEAFMQAGHRKLNNLIAIIDRNKLQIDGCTEDVMSLGDVASKINQFGWNTCEINGHDFNEIYEACETAKKSDKPFAIIANTIKGKGVSFMENQAGWHGKAPNDEQLNQALEELK